MEGRGVFVFAVLLSLVFFAGSAFALEGNRVIANSENWEDVYSTLLYSSLNEIEGDFLTSTTHGPILLNSIPVSSRLGIVSSRENPFVFSYAPLANSRDYSEVNEILVDNANLELIEEPEMRDIENFIIVDDSYGFSAMAVTPYAVLTNAWVFIVDRANIAEVEDLLSRRNVENLMIYGYVEREVSEALSIYDPVVINSGDRFEDNVAIVEEYLKLEKTTQILLSNGEFIERELMSGIHPILFTGRDNVPDKIAEYLKESDITVGVLIGNELINAATNIRRDTGISVMVKFAQGARSGGAGVSAVEGLDLFYMPTPTIGLQVYSVKYNRATSMVEITYHSTSNVPAYLKGTITVITGDGERKKAGDIDSIFIAPNDYKTITYPDFNLDGGNLRAEVVTLFGEIPTALDRQLSGVFDMEIISVIDKCEIEIDRVKYNLQKDSFVIPVKNLADVACYVDIELTEVMIDGFRQTLGTEGSFLIKAGKREDIEIGQRMSEEDLEDNPYIDLVAYYGEREEALVNTFRGKFELDIDSYSWVTYAIIVLIILIILLILWWFFFLRRRKEKDAGW